jgi:hypothetical protein
MMTKTGVYSGVLVLLLAAGPTASAHHSAAATYDADRVVEIRGTVFEFAWKNPHCHLYVDVTEGRFTGMRYMVELGSAEALSHAGWTKTLLRVGDQVVMGVHPSRIDAAVGLCRDCAFTINGKPPVALRPQIEVR